MKTIAIIRENDEENGKIIRLGYIRLEYDGEKGWQVAASNGDDVGYYTPKSKAECIADIVAMWGNWATFKLKES